MQQKEIIFQKKPIICLCALACTALWGSAFPCIKTGYLLFSIDSSDTASVILFAGLRFFGAGILTILIGSAGQKKILHPSRNSWGRIFTLCMFQTVIQYLFFYIGLAHTTGVKGSILNGSGTLFALIFSCLLFRQEKMTISKLTGCLTGFAGMVLVNLAGSGISGGFTLTGEGFMIISAACYAFSSIFLKKFSAKDSPVMLSGYQFAVGGAVMIGIGLLSGGRLQPVRPAAFGLLLYMMFISAAAYSLWGILLKYNPVSGITIFGFMNPVFGVILSAIILKEQGSLGAQTLISLVLVCLGIYLVNRGGEKPVDPPGRP